VTNMEVVIEGNCYISGRMERCCIGIENGRIQKVAKLIEGEKVFRFGTKIILPAAIDAHVHFRDPGMTQNEDFATGSLAAIHGGVSCVFDMPNTRPPTTTLSALRDKKRIASSKSMVDFGLFAGVRPGLDVGALAKEAIGFKLYMASTTGELMVPSLESIKKEIAAIAATGKVLAVHAEDESLRRKDIEENLEDHLRNRNNECERSAIRKVKVAANGCKLHICHVSGKASLPLIQGVPNLTSEITPHHMLFDISSQLGALAKVNPPLRKREDRHAMFQGLKEGMFDMIASDHAPHAMDEKKEDFDYAPTGMPGVETLVPLMLNLVKERHLDISGAVRRLSERPGEVYGLNKGKIAPGYDADLMIVDMTQSTIIKADKLHSKCGWTAYQDMPGIFPQDVFLRGQLMVENGSQVGERIGRDVIGSR
jgi:dihydroorotase